MSHQVELEELMKFANEEKVMFASSSKENKKLFITLRGSYEVWHNGKRVWETMQPFIAVEKYNEI